MTQMVQGKVRALEALSGPELDRQHMETPVVLHGHTLDHVLIPNAENARLRALLQQSRGEVEQHLPQAQQIHHRMTM